MPALRTYHLFISHAWKYSDDYNGLINLLKKAPLFDFKDYSDPKVRPIVDPTIKIPTREMENILIDQMNHASCVLVIGGMYLQYRDWMQKEIDIAFSLHKPIFGVIPFGQERLPSAITHVADTVRWNTDSIINKIRECSI